MRILSIVMTLGLVASAAQAEEVDNRCGESTPPIDIGTLTEEEQDQLVQLEAIENDPVVQAQAAAEAQVSIDAFGGCADEVTEVSE